jgi:hypothetical protein
VYQDQLRAVGIDTLPAWPWLLAAAGVAALGALGLGRARGAAERG